MKFIYCSKCNTRLPITKVGLKQYAQVIDVVNPHVCASERISFDVYFKQVEPMQYVDKEFVQIMDELPPAALGSISTANLRDRRSAEHVKSSAPSELSDALKKLTNSPLEHPMEDPEDG